MVIIMDPRREGGVVCVIFVVHSQSMFLNLCQFGLGKEFAIHYSCNCCMVGFIIFESFLFRHANVRASGHRRIFFKHNIVRNMSMLFWSSCSTLIDFSDSNVADSEASLLWGVLLHKIFPLAFNQGIRTIQWQFFVPSLHLALSHSNRKMPAWG